MVSRTRSLPLTRKPVGFALCGTNHPEPASMTSISMPGGFSPVQVGSTKIPHPWAPVSTKTAAPTIPALHVRPVHFNVTLRASFVSQSSSSASQQTGSCCQCCARIPLPARSGAEKATRGGVVATIAAVCDEAVRHSARHSLARLCDLAAPRWLIRERPETVDQHPVQKTRTDRSCRPCCPSPSTTAGRAGGPPRMSQNSSPQ